MASDNQSNTIARHRSYWSLAFVSLGYRDFCLFWLGSVTEHLGEFMELAAILWLVSELTPSPFMLTAVASARFVSMVFFPLAGGVVADRVNRRSMLICALLVSGFLSICLAILTFTRLVALWHLIVIVCRAG